MWKDLKYSGLVLLAAASGIALGQAERPGGPRGDALFPVLDRNSDGVLSQDELDLAISALRKLDRNKDGSVSGAELRPDAAPSDSDANRQGDRERPGGERNFRGGGGGREGDDNVWEILSKKYDQDKNGEISKSEYTRGEEKFRSLDQNKDSKLTADDFSGGRSRGRGGLRGFSGMAQSRLVRMADADENQEVTKAEWEKFLGSLNSDDEGVIGKPGFEERLREGGAGRMAARMIDLLDKDGNDELTKKEVASVWPGLDADKDGVVKGEELAPPRGGGRGRPGGGRGERSGAPKEGENAPDFELAYASKDGSAKSGKKVRLSSFKGEKPVALVFGSYT